MTPRPSDGSHVELRPLLVRCLSNQCNHFLPSPLEPPPPCHSVIYLSDPKAGIASSSHTASKGSNLLDLRQPSMKAVELGRTEVVVDTQVSSGSQILGSWKQSWNLSHTHAHTRARAPHPPPPPFPRTPTLPQHSSATTISRRTKCLPSKFLTRTRRGARS